MLISWRKRERQEGGRREEMEGGGREEWEEREGEGEGEVERGGLEEEKETRVLEMRRTSVKQSSMLTSSASGES